MNLVALMNPWLPGRKTHTCKCTTQKNIHFCLLNAFNYMLTLPLLSTAQNQRGLNWTGTLLLVYFWNFSINTITANHRAIWCELQPRSLVFPCFLRFSFSFFFPVACIRLSQFSFLLRRRLYASQKTPHLYFVKDNTVLLIEDIKNQNRNIEFENNYGTKPTFIYTLCSWRLSSN